jgi:hypothetical protein
MATAVFEKWATDLETRCASTEKVPGDKEVACIACHKQADYNLVRLAFHPGYATVRYSICKKCRGSEKSEALIDGKMKAAWRNKDDSHGVFLRSVDDAVFHYFLLGF